MSEAFWLFASGLQEGKHSMLQVLAFCFVMHGQQSLAVELLFTRAYVGC